MVPKIITPLRWTGGKTKAINKIKDRFPVNFDSFYESFLGGGSVFLYLKQLYPDRNFFVNDLNEKVYNLWHWIQKDPQQVSDMALEYSESTPRTEDAGRALFNSCVELLYSKDAFNFSIEEAVMFWVLNKIQYSGSEKAKFSGAAFGIGNYLGKGAFSSTNAKRLKSIGEVLNQGSGATIECIDYEDHIKGASENDFIFLDPPYKLLSKSNLYGKLGEFHKGFDHTRFADVVNSCKAKVMVTYDANDDHLSSFNSTNTFDTFDQNYSTVWGKDGKAVKAKELLIRNYS